MFIHYLRSLFNTSGGDTDGNQEGNEAPFTVSGSLEKNLTRLQGDFSGSGDLIIRTFTAGGYDCAAVSLENMTDKDLLNKDIMQKLCDTEALPDNPDERFLYIYNAVSSSVDQRQLCSMDEINLLLCSGWAVIFIDGCIKALGFSVQGYKVRSIDDPANEVTERGSREGFVESVKINATMIRRRMKSTDLVFDYMRAGKSSNTDILLCYMKNAVSPDVVRKIRRKILDCPLESVLESAYLQPFLEDRPLSLFSSVGTSERPDTVCAKISEGRVAIIVDGTPFCLIIPYLFSENFQNLDDYTIKPYFSTFIRFLKYVSFFTSLLLPGVYVALGEFNPEIFPSAMLYKIIDAETATPFPLMEEALIIHFIYEIMREAGLRLPKSLGHAVSIVGALVIGEAAVTAGLIGAPMIMVVAITALSSFVVPTLYYPGAILRFAFIFAGGMTGIYGVMLLFAMAVIGILSLNPYGVPFSAPVSPFDITSVRDTVVRAGWRTLAKKTIKIGSLHGSEKTRD